MTNSNQPNNMIPDAMAAHKLIDKHLVGREKRLMKALVEGDVLDYDAVEEIIGCAPVVPDPEPVKPAPDFKSSLTDFVGEEGVRFLKGFWAEVTKPTTKKP